MRIAIYARVSKDDGTQDPQNQVNPLRDFAKAIGGEVVDEYVDMASGSNGDRVQFQRLLTDADARKFDLVLVWSLDRVSREGISNTIGYLERLKRSGVYVKSLQESWLDTRDDGLGQLMISIFSWVAHQERKRIIERTRAAINKRKDEIEKNGFFINKAGEKVTKLGRKDGQKDKPGLRRRSSKYFKDINPKRAKKVQVAQ